MTSYNPRKSEFKYPKPLFEHSSNNNNNNRLLSPRRPQPSPSKSQLLMQELGLDENFKASDTSESSDFSDDDTLATTGGPTQAEYDALQKERDGLLVRTKENQDQIRSLQGRLHREETKRKSHVNILKKTQNELLKDKDQLITNLEDVVFDGEQKIKQLEDDLKGNPIRPTIEKPAQVSSIHKFVENIKTLHNEKSELREKLMNLEQEMEEKSVEIMHFREERPRTTEVIHRVKSQTDNEKVVEKLKKEITELKSLLQEREDAVAVEKETVESVTKEIEDLERKVKKLEDEKKKTERKNKSEIEKLKRELERKNEEIEDLENKPPEVVTKMVEKVVEVESSEQKSEIGEARSKIYQLETMCREAERSTKKAKDEVARLKNDLARQQDLLNETRIEAEETSATHQEEENKLQDQVRQLETDLAKEKKNVEKSKKNVNKEKEKVTSLEQEMQELQASHLRRARDEAMVEVEGLKKKMSKQEEDANQEVKELTEAAESQRKESEKMVEKLESKVMKTEEKLMKMKEQNQDLHSKLDKKSRKVDSLTDSIENKNTKLTSMQTIISELQSNVDKEKRKVAETQEKLMYANDVNVTLQEQVKDLSGASDNATVQLSGQRSENAKLRIELNHSRVLAEENAGKAKDAEARGEQLKEQLMQLDQQLVFERNEHQVELKNLQEQHSSSVNNVKSSANAEVHAVSSKMYKTQCSLRQLLSSVHILVKENHHLKKECSRFPLMIEEATRHAAKQIVDSISEIDDHSKELIRRYKKEMKLRKKYHNELVELKGNIRVFVRVRPTISEDGSGNQIRNAVTYDRDDDAMIYVHNSQRGRSQLFELDKVFQPDSTQLEVYSEVQPLVISCIDGYHVCIFAYGQTGSGKTYTMEGPPSDPGINQRALGDLFHEIEDKAGDWQYEVAVSLVEIYNETLKDLLATHSSSEKLEIKMNSDGSLYVPRLTSERVENLDDVNALFRLGHNNRATACTNMNEHSSRSHAVLIVNVKGSNETTGAKTYGKLNLIDLAGSERVSKSGASGDRLKEAQNINKSLSALGDVIHALRGKQAHVPFRNSKLTYLLQDSLSKDSKTLMVVQVAPVEKNVSETVCSLSFAQRVRTVELGQASKKTEDGRQEESHATPKKSGIPSSKGAQQLRRKM